MLDILLFLLKCIGFLLLGVFGLLVTILIVTLLVPVRYRLIVSHGDKTTVDGTATWLLHILRAKYSLKEKKKRIWIRLFGIIVYDSTKPKSRKTKKKASKKKKRKKASKKLSKSKKNRKTKDKAVSKDKVVSKDKAVSKKKSDTKEKTEITQKEESKLSSKLQVEDHEEARIVTSKVVSDNKEYRTKDTIDKDMVSEADKDIRKEESLNKDEALNTDDLLKDKALNTDDFLKEEALNTEETHNTDDLLKDKAFNTDEATNNDELSKDEDINDDVFDDFDPMEKERWYHRIKYWKEQITRFFTDFKEKIFILYQKLINMKDKLRNIRDFFDLEENKLGLGTSFGSLTKIILHLKPSKMVSRFRFGTGDPCTTGQALGIAAALYGIYGENIQITPDFEEKVFEGYHYVKGRIRIGTLLIIVIKLVIGKEFKKLKDNFKILKEAL